MEVAAPHYDSAPPADMTMTLAPSDIVIVDTKECKICMGDVAEADGIVCVGCSDFVCTECYQRNAAACASRYASVVRDVSAPGEEPDERCCTDGASIPCPTMRIVGGTASCTAQVSIRGGALQEACCSTQGRENGLRTIEALEKRCAIAFNHLRERYQESFSGEPPDDTKDVTLEDNPWRYGALANVEKMYAVMAPLMPWVRHTLFKSVFSQLRMTGAPMTWESLESAHAEATPPKILLAAQRENWMAVCQVLTQRPDEVTRHHLLATLKGWTMLHLAAQSGKVKVVLALIEAVKQARCLDVILDQKVPLVHRTALFLAAESDASGEPAGLWQTYIIKAIYHENPTRLTLMKWDPTLDAEVGSPITVDADVVHHALAPRASGERDEDHVLDDDGMEAKGSAKELRPHSYSSVVDMAAADGDLEAPHAVDPSDSGDIMIADMFAAPSESEPQEHQAQRSADDLPLSVRISGDEYLWSAALNRYQLGSKSSHWLIADEKLYHNRLRYAIEPLVEALAKLMNSVGPRVHNFVTFEHNLLRKIVTDHLDLVVIEKLQNAQYAHPRGVRKDIETFFVAALAFVDRGGGANVAAVRERVERYQFIFNSDFRNLFRKERKAFVVGDRVERTSVFQSLLNAGANAWHVDHHKQTVLMAAAMRGHTEAARVLIRHLSYGHCAVGELSGGAATEEKDVVRVIKRMVMARQHEGWGAIGIAAWKGHSGVLDTVLTEVYKILLLRRGAEEAVHEIKELVNEDYVMIVHSADVPKDANQRKMRRTALHLASEAGRGQNVQSLLRWGADLCKVDDGERSALLIASSLGRDDAVWHLTRGVLLLDDPAGNLIGKIVISLSLAQIEKWPPLHAAAHAGHHRIVHQLLEFAQFLHRTYPEKMSEVELNAWANAVHLGGKQHRRTALHMASERGHALAIDAFALHGYVDFAKKDKYGETAIDLARERGHRCEAVGAARETVKFRICARFTELKPRRPRGKEPGKLGRAAKRVKRGKT